MHRYLVLIIIFSVSLNSQDLYFPPAQGEWEGVDPIPLGWNMDELDNTLQYIEESNSKAFIILKDGRMAFEWYSADFGPDSLWYWASAAKALTATLVGIAQQDGIMDINEPVAEYLGRWTSMSQDRENAIKVYHSLSMSTGVEDIEIENDCLDPECFKYFREPGTRWDYNNSAYRLLLDMIEEASGQNRNTYTYQKLQQKIGMGGLWTGYIRVSTARDFARFGLFTLAKGNWNGEQILTDMDYYNAMINTSQEMNKSYGYLWWLNGKESYLLPTVDIELDGSLVPEAPSDMFAGLGKNDQKVYVVPSMNMVVIRMGDSAEESKFASSSFDNKLWQRLMKIFPSTSVEDELEAGTYFHDGVLYFNEIDRRKIDLYNILGNKIFQTVSESNVIKIDDLERGVYLINISTPTKNYTLKIMQ